MAAMVTDLPDTQILRDPGKVDKHPPFPNFAQDFIANCFKWKAVDDMSEPSSKLICNEILSDSRKIRWNLLRKDVLQNRRCVIDERRAEFLSLSQTWSKTLEPLDLMVSNNKAATPDGACINNHENEIVVFGTTEGFRFRLKWRRLLWMARFIAVSLILLNYSSFIESETIIMYRYYFVCCLIKKGNILNVVSSSGK